MRSKEVDFGKGSCAYNILLNLWRNQDDYTFRRRSRSVSEEEEEEEEEDGEFDDSRTGRLRYIYSTLSIYLARVELVKLSEMLEKAYIPRRSEFGGFLHARDIRAIPT